MSANAISRSGAPTADTSASQSEKTAGGTAPESAMKSLGSESISYSGHDRKLLTPDPPPPVELPPIEDLDGLPPLPDDFYGD